MQILISVAFVAILGSLGAALFFMLRGSPTQAAQTDEQRAKRMARALAFRVGFSILLFALILLSYAMGWIQPTGINAGQ